MTTGRTLRRSAKLLKAFRLEQSDPDYFYDLLAGDAASRVGERVPLSGALVLDVGGGAGYLAKAFRAAGSTCFVAEPDLTELSWRGTRPDGAVIGDGYRLPFRSGTADLVLSSNVLEHVQRPYQMLEELARVTRPGGFIWVSFTNWYSPWGGHEISPWHYLGAERALARYRRRYARSPKNLLGTSLFKVHVGRLFVMSPRAACSSWWTPVPAIIRRLREGSSACPDCERSSHGISSCCSAARACRLRLLR